jgi:hypothetical protein
MPDFDQLTANPYMPDPFTMYNGTRITTKAQWCVSNSERIVPADCALVCLDFDTCEYVVSVRIV